MINLIPTEEKKKMVRGFYLRFAVVCFTNLGGTILIASIAMLPSYFFVSIKKGVIDQKIQNQKNIPLSTSDIEISSIVSDINKKLQIIENSQKDSFSLTGGVINEIILKKTPDIKITQISYENITTEGRRIKINGSAPSREKLLLFRLALEDNPAFKSVDLPISNFVKGTDIEFSVTLITS